MTREEMRKTIEAAQKLVASWPPWKQNILVQSARPTVEVPRKFVDNFNGSRDSY